jgi:uncharacterized membrane protein
MKHAIANATTLLLALICVILFVYILREYFRSRKAKREFDSLMREFNQK